ncbi:PIN-like domain-containing protein [Agromyces sp. NPDC057865]|uniref:PIN-like domain-containing protein n=1 Tax=Agromyces sp. NPDC057865 TaxID=3346267 RepID=UPI00366DF14E
MALPEVEDRLLERLSLPQLSAETHLRALDVTVPEAMDDVAAIGVDTNILKALRREPTFADSLFVTVQSTETTLIAPGQCVIEYWNNHKVFASEDWNTFKNDLAKLTKHLDSDGVDGHDEEAVREIQRLVGDLTRDLEESRNPEYLKKSQALMRQLLDSATMPMVSRSRLASLAEVRLASKTPPGWADDKSKSAALGDFFGWCDFLFGVLCAEDPRKRTKFLFVTDDTKPDWRTGAMGHPALIAEFDWVCDGQLSIISLQDLRKLLAADARTKPATVDAEAEESPQGGIGAGPASTSESEESTQSGTEAAPASRTEAES